MSARSRHGYLKGDGTLCHREYSVHDRACLADSRGWACTRERGHLGQHHAHTTVRCHFIWGKGRLGIDYEGATKKESSPLWKRWWAEQEE